jgi:hypothetical protein
VNSSERQHQVKLCDIKTNCKALSPCGLAGDYNVIPTDLDVYKPDRWTNDALFLPEVRDAFARLLLEGGPMHCENCIRTKGSTPSGTTSEMPGTGMRAFASIICCSPPRWPRSTALSPSIAARLVGAGVDPRSSRLAEGERSSADLGGNRGDCDENILSSEVVSRHFAATGSLRSPFSLLRPLRHLKLQRCGRGFRQCL